MEHIKNSVSELIGNTPLLKLNSIKINNCNIFMKMESKNPGGSIKDRIAKTMIEEALKDGSLKKGQMIVEATAGNTGISLAMIANQKGHPCIIIVPDKMSNEKVKHIKALGAKVIVTRSDVHKGHPEYYMDLAHKIAQENNAYFVNQFANPNNPKAHYLYTAPELFSQLDNVDAVVMGVGSGGTVTGFGQYIKENNINCELICADPVGSMFAELINNNHKIDDVGSWLVEGIGQDIVPEICDLSYFKKAYSISDKEAILTVLDLIKKEGIIAGSSSGTLLAAAKKYAHENKEKNIVTFCCDTGDKYLSKIYDTDWLFEKLQIEL